MAERPLNDYAEPSSSITAFPSILEEVTAMEGQLEQVEVRLLERAG